jgi:ribonuclease BN (tRNA processing enzyme)
MKINLLGVRGSIPATGPESSFYGGNTSCITVHEDDWTLVLDVGSGIQNFQHTSSSKRIDVLLTHLHMDHIQGLGFFKKLFDPTMEIHIWGPASGTKSLQGRLSRYLSPPLFPVLIRDLPCMLSFHEIENSSFAIGPFTIQSGYIIHPGPTVGFRIQGHQSVLTYLPDHEPALGQHGMIPDRKWVSGIDLAAGADILVHDAQYTHEEYQSKKGWGHSSIDDTAQFAMLAQVKHLLFSHHDPSRTDAQLNDLLGDIKQRTNYPFTYEFAREGTEITLV